MRRQSKWFDGTAAVPCSVQFSMDTGLYVAVTERTDNGTETTVVMSPAQYRALVKFVAEPAP